MTTPSTIALSEPFISASRHQLALAFSALEVCSRTEARWTFACVCPSATCWSPPVAGARRRHGRCSCPGGRGRHRVEGCDDLELDDRGPRTGNCLAEVEPVEVALPGSPVTRLEFTSGSFDEDTPTRVTPSMSSRDATKAADRVLAWGAADDLQGGARDLGRGVAAPCGAAAISSWTAGLTVPVELSETSLGSTSASSCRTAASRSGSGRGSRPCWRGTAGSAGSSMNSATLCARAVSCASSRLEVGLLGFAIGDLLAGQRDGDDQEQQNASPPIST